jgi:hypothetical protein
VDGESTSQMDLSMCMLLLGEEQWPLLAVVYIAAGTEGGRGSWGRRDRESSAEALAGDGRNDQPSAAARKESLAVIARDGQAERAPSWLLHRLCVRPSHLCQIPPPTPMAPLPIPPDFTYAT